MAPEPRPRRRLRAPVVHRPCERDRGQLGLEEVFTVEDVDFSEDVVEPDFSDEPPPEPPPEPFEEPLEVALEAAGSLEVGLPRLSLR
jgi:hypothetical protein